MVKVVEKVPAAKSNVVHTKGTYSGITTHPGRKEEQPPLDVQSSFRCLRQSLATEREYGEGAGPLGDVLRAL